MREDIGARANQAYAGFAGDEVCIVHCSQLSAFAGGVRFLTLCLGVDVLNSFVASARRRRETPLIENRDRAATVGD